MNLLIKQVNELADTSDEAYKRARQEVLEPVYS